ncbi:alanyl-tRNA synthetase [Serratia entomophila]|uniref:alanyl-tRNA editing protein n=1 Tax=Serratia entomophila TaxID=42906 RepID=UPI00217810AB|nr:alanyl-tRNA editing protein [Serratia entomophila]CAI0729339.1 alanyl-tRNA synthetase [Serratia entomophila]CAI1664631.1 alanyl-tRNA synthetase [Serratia entomophila]
MTERHYYYSDDLQAEARVLACTPAEDGAFAIELDATPFHPQGGGQPADGGTLGDVAVLRVTQQGDKVLHFTAEPLPLGPVIARVDGEQRRLHTRWHSAGHLIGWLGETRGWQPVKAHHWPGEGRITFTPGACAQTLEQGYLQAELAQLIAADLPRRQQEVEGKRQVGFGELPAYGCGGTHVASLSELGEVNITAVKMKKGQLIVQYEMG